MPTFDEEKQEKKLDELRKREEEALVQATAQKLGLSYIDMTGVGVDTDALKIIPEEEARKLEMATFKKVAKDLHVAARSPLRQSTQDKINELQKEGYNIAIYMVSQKSLAKAWDRYKDISQAFQSTGGLLDISQESLRNIVNEIHNNEDIKKMFDTMLESKVAHKVSRLMEILFGSAIATGASDIHIEPQEEDVRIRLRQDGVLHDVVLFDHENYHMINSRIKLLSGLKLTQTENAQDGRFTIAYNDMDIEIRTSMVPSSYGEGIVMRILNPEGINVGLEQLGIPKKLLDILKTEIAKPNGLMLVTGPTGSGKTTTLYSFLKYIYTPEIKIITIEDPIEYHLDGITQTQVEHDKGYDFLAGLRAAMRQDPDVALVGEIRDNETATIAVNASLTGHLVLSTLHTNNAAGAIPRLLDLGVIPGVLAAALSVTIAQRLVRKLCPHCKQEAVAEGAEEEILRTTIKNALALGKSFDEYDFSIEGPLKIWKPVGCEKCHDGYKGRLGVYEAILADENIQMVLEEHPSERKLKIVSAAQGILTMKEDGVAKILGGITSMDEIRDVVDLTEDLELFPEMKEHADAHKKNSTSPDNIEKSGTTSINIAPEQNEVRDDSSSSLNNSMPISSTQSTALELLVDYLKMLESESVQQHNPQFEEKVRKAEHVIAQLIKTGNLAPFPTEEERADTEIELLMQQLQSLREEPQKKKSGLADVLSSIRSALNKL